MTIANGRPTAAAAGMFTLMLITAACGASAQSSAAPSKPAAPVAAAPSATTPTTLEEPKPYDPTKPVDLGGIPGVTPAEQHRAENLVRATLVALRTYANVDAAYAAGYRTIGDAITGDEHYVKWAYVDDGHILDPTRPESLVYEMRDGRKTLVAAMYMLPFGSRFSDVPDVGGPLTQWHVHRDLCLTDDPMRKIVAGFVFGDGECPPGTTKAGNTPMLHVWIVPNKCGPFAALEGIGGGQIPDGQTRLCDTAHGLPSPERVRSRPFHAGGKRGGKDAQGRVIARGPIAVVALVSAALIVVTSSPAVARRRASRRSHAPIPSFRSAELGAALRSSRRRGA